MPFYWREGTVGVFNHANILSRLLDKGLAPQFADSRESRGMQVSKAMSYSIIHCQFLPAFSRLKSRLTKIDNMARVPWKDRDPVTKLLDIGYTENGQNIWKVHLTGWEFHIRRLAKLLYFIEQLVKLIEVLYQRQMYQGNIVHISYRTAESRKSLCSTVSKCLFKMHYQ